MLACARLGAIHSVVFSAFSSTALRVRLKDTEAKILITADGYYRRGQVVSLKTNADEGIKDTKVEKVIVVKRAGNEIPWDAKKNIWYESLVKNENNYCKPQIMDSEDPLFILYTSGSTGKPKGAVHCNGGYAVQATLTARWVFDLRDEDIFWSTADIGWVTGHTYSCYGALLNGITFIIFEGAPDWPTPDRWAQIIEKYGVTIFYTAPTAIRMFEKYGAEIIRKYKFKTLRLLGSVGEPIDEDAWRWYFQEIGRKRCPIVDTWWQTETGGILITSLPGIGPFRPSFAGLPLPGIKFDILASAQIEDFEVELNKKLCRKAIAQNKLRPDQTSPAGGREGNLVILPPFAPGMLRGIYKNPEKYLETYWSQYGKEKYFTSDGAYKDKQGLIRIVGRVDDVIKVAGHRLTTGELENVIEKHKDITECAVVGIPDKIRGEIPVAFVVLDKKREPAEIKKEVIEQVRKEIGPITLLKEIYIVEDLPKTRSGKIMRRILRKLFTKEELGDLSTLANPESIEKMKQNLQ
jgi:acetyl-CoA synthetase